MNRVIMAAWPLFLGLGLIMVGNGLQGTLLGVRANIDGFSTATTGLIMSLYYLGFMVGSLIAPKLVENVGHIRVFSALASLASTTVLFHAIFPSAILWGLIRIMTGFGFAGIFIVVESWLNGLATNKNRGQVLALYILITYGGMAIGQFLLNLADPGSATLFILTSVLVSLALVPISLSKRPAPDFSAPERLKIKTLFQKSPTGVIGAIMSGVSGGTVFAIGAVYAIQSGMDTAQVSTFMAFLFWGMGVPIYALSIAYTNDHLEQHQILAASSSLILLNGIGACIGPLSVTGLMSIFGTEAFFPGLSIIFALTCLFTLYRSTVSEAIPVDEQGSYVVTPARSSHVMANIIEDDDDSAVNNSDTQEKTGAANPA